MYIEGAEPPRIGVKGVITMTKQVRFKSTVKEASSVSEPNQFFQMLQFFLIAVMSSFRLIMIN